MPVSVLSHPPTTATGVGREVMLPRTVRRDPSLPAIGVTQWGTRLGSAPGIGRWGPVRIQGQVHTVIGVRRGVILPDSVLLGRRK